MYKLIKDADTMEVIAINRLSDNAYIPLDIKNIDYQAYLDWVTEGNSAEE